MNKLVTHQSTLFYKYAILSLIFLAVFQPMNLSAQAGPHFIRDHLDLIINVNNIATHGEISTTY